MSPLIIQQASQPVANTALAHCTAWPTAAHVHVYIAATTTPPRETLQDRWRPWGAKWETQSCPKRNERFYSKAYKSSNR